MAKMTTKMTTNFSHICRIKGIRLNSKEIGKKSKITLLQEKGGKTEGVNPLILKLCSTKLNLCKDY